MEGQVPGVLQEEEVPHRRAEPGSWEVVVEEAAAEVQHLEAEAEEEVEEVVVEAPHSKAVSGALVAKVQARVGGVEGVVWEGAGAVGQEEVMPSGEWVRCLPQSEAVLGCLCCHLWERAGLKRRCSAFWALPGYFWLPCSHPHRV